jgi:uncharacterized protein (TIGR03437 family)
MIVTRNLSLSLFTFVLTALPAATPNFTVILGQPTDRSITVDARADTAVELYFEYGVKSTVYTSQTTSAVAAADPYATGFFVSQAVMSGLQPDTQYYYRMEYRIAGSTAAFTPGTEYSFHTERLPGSTFAFCVQGDSHPERDKTMFNSNLYIQTLTAVAAEHPDFYITSGDDFSVDTLPAPYTSAAVTGRYTLQLPYLNIVGRNSPIFLGTGNHEQTSLWNYNLPADNNNSNMVPVWAQNARNLYYAVPAPNDPTTGTFYTGNTTSLPGIGLLRDYYAWQWGDALFVVIDPYWASPAQVDSTLGDDTGSSSGKTTNKWSITHGDPQYEWLKQTLEQSGAKWKFVFAHHVMGTGRGGIEIANQYEWGGDNSDGTWGFTTNRPTWALPLHELLVANHATIFFQAHDHLFAHQQIDGMTYQELPNPADFTYTAFNADAYTSGDIFPNSGYTKVTVGPSSVKVEYIREWLPQDATPAQASGTVQFAYTIPATGSAIAAPTIASVANAEGESPTISPNTWVEIKGSNLAPAGDSRSWQASDFVNDQLPMQLDGVSVTVNETPAYVYYISPTQINVLTAPGAMSGPVAARVAVAGAVSAAFTAHAQAMSPAFFVFGGGPYVAATHANGTYIGAATLYPGLTTPAQPGETIVLYANGFGPTSAPVAPGSMAQSGSLAKLPAVQIGGAAATVQFAGLVAPGQFQFNMVVPPNIADGDQSITATYNGLSTQAGTLLTVHH